MARTYDKPVIIEEFDEVTEEWHKVYGIHCHINKKKSDSNYFNAGSMRTQKSLVFETRYFKGLEQLSYQLQKYRLIYQGIPFRLEDYDDYMEMHKNIKLLGVAQ